MKIFKSDFCKNDTKSSNLIMIFDVLRFCSCLVITLVGDEKDLEAQLDK